MNLNEAVLARRAVRAYTSRKVEDATVRLLLHAAVQAPSAMNRQPWLFSIVQDVGQLKRYSDLAKTMLLAQMPGDSKTGHYAERLQSPAFNIFYDASTLIVIGVGERGAYADADCWLAAANLMLAATDIGLATCPIGFAIPILNVPQVKTEIGLPPSGVAVAPILVGYPTVSSAPVPRADPKVISWSRA
jgi:nitroreductase